jgi:sulfide dehydrogenase cytochrome subunit
MVTQRMLATATIMAIFSCNADVAVAEIDAVLPICVGCHGANGVGIAPNIPTIGGIPDLIQEDAIFAYIDGDRDCTTNAVKCGIMSGLTEEQVTELAAHFSAMPYVLAEEDFDAALAEQGKARHDADCAICHGNDPSADESSIVHGQRLEYLRIVMTEYAAGERKQVPAMEETTSDLSEAQIEALIQYYASYRDQ